jgi:polyferredoxin
MHAGSAIGPLADLILGLHAAYVLFVVGGLALIWLGIWRGWRWVRHFWFRLLHLAAIGLVAAEALIGLTCPLTVLEDWLRSESDPSMGFVARWVQRALFWDFPGWVFTLVYLVFALLAVLTWRRWPPAPRARLAGAR